MSEAGWCACGPRCGKRAGHTEFSPYMDDYCDDCTWTRCDVSFDVHRPVVVSPVPRWLELTAEIDFAYWQLGLIGEQIVRQLGTRTPIEALVDESTGYEAAVMEPYRAQAELIGQLRREYESLSAAPVSSVGEPGTNE